MEKTQIDLIILSPSPEVNKLSFPAISTATTVGELREKISSAAVTHPAPTRQRLIYRGHALVDAKKTLKEIFTQDIIDSSDTLSLHLALPPETAAQPSRSSTPASVPGQAQRSHTPQHVHGNLDVGGNSTSSQQSNHPGQTPHDAGQGNGPSISNPSLPPFQTQHGHGHHHHHPQVHAHGHLGNGQFPPQLQQAFAQFHAVNQQLAAQLAAIGNNPALQGLQSTQVQGQPFQQPVYTFNQAHYPHIIPHHQHPRAAGTQQGMRGSPQHTGSNDTPPPLSQAENAPAQDVTQTPTPPPGPANTNTVVRENVGPNGERWQMIVQSGPVNMNPIALGSHRANILSQPSNAIRDHLGHNVGLIQLHSNLSAIEAALSTGNPPPESVFDQARETLNAIPEVQEDAQSLARRRIDYLADRANQLRRNSHDTFIREAHERAATHRGTQGAESSAVYVLSSPSGPQALLVSPLGLYTTPWQFPALGTITPHSSTNYAPNPATNAQSLTQNNVTNRQQPQADAAQVAHVHQQVPQQAGPAQIAQVQQQPQQQQPNQARDLLRILLPLGGHLWLIIRLFGFVYFFTAGAGWRRTILLGLLAMLVFIAQTGIFRPIILGIWDPIRRHAEGLVPLVGNERPHAAAVGNHDNGNTAGTGPPNREPRPSQALQALMQGRELQNGNIVRQSIRRVERAIALFVASLVPGVGERHIAAREAAREAIEEARQLVAREMEERARREQEEAEQRQEANAPGQSAAAGSKVENSAAGGQGQTAQRPLVEI